jgi:peptidyl-prolyl cis-trans isomerase A (cyclophilin A)
MLLKSLVRCFRGYETPSQRPTCFEPLENRIVLAGSPFPLADTDLIDSSNTVVRIETNLGDIDIELFDQNGPGGSAAPITTTNFLNYVRDGDWDETFMHRLVNGFVLQMGGFAFDDVGGISTVPADPPIVNEFNAARSNIERTVAMAKLGGNPDSATSQFFINLGDNSANLNTQNGGFTVFGRVATDASWTVVTAINALSTADFSTTHGALGGTPVNTSFSPGDPISESALVTIIDIEIIKPTSISASDDRFYTEILAYPEGYRSDTVVESVALVNPGATDSAYQIVVRYERGVRDQVIATGTLGSNEHRTITISDFSSPSAALVRESVPYAIEIHSTGVFAASLTHTDFGATTQEAFFNVQAGKQTTLPAAEQTNWELGGTAAVTTLPSDPNITRLPFLTYLNDSANFAFVTITFTPQGGGSAVSITKGLEAHRRGGLEVFNIAGVTDALAGISISSTQPIIAALSVYEQQTSTGPAPVLSNFAYSAQASSGAGHAAGILAGVEAGGTGENFLTIFNDNSTGAVVSFEFISSTGTILRSVIVSPNSRAEFNLADVITPASGFVTVRYSSAASPVTVQYVSTQGGDLVATPFSSRGSGFWTFAGGGFDPTGSGSEVISVFNPHRTASVMKQLVVRYYFSDGTATSLPFSGLTLDSGERIDLDISDLTDTRFDAVRAKIQSDPAFSTYSVSIFSTITSGPGGVVPTSIVAQMTQVNGSSNSATTGGVPLVNADYLLLDDPLLSGGTPL